MNLFVAIIGLLLLVVPTGKHLWDSRLVQTKTQIIYVTMDGNEIQRVQKDGSWDESLGWLQP